MSRDFFAAEGVILGEPVLRELNAFFVPVEFTTEVMRSALWLYNVDHRVEKNTIFITAKVSKPPKGPESGYEGGILLAAPEPGEYEVKYADPGGANHDIGIITIPDAR